MFVSFLIELLTARIMPRQYSLYHFLGFQQNNSETGGIYHKYVGILCFLFKLL